MVIGCPCFLFPMWLWWSSALGWHTKPWTRLCGGEKKKIRLPSTVLNLQHVKLFVKVCYPPAVCSDTLITTVLFVPVFALHCWVCAAGSYANVWAGGGSHTRCRSYIHFNLHLREKSRHRGVYITGICLLQRGRKETQRLFKPNFLLFNLYNKHWVRTQSVLSLPLPLPLPLLRSLRLTVPPPPSDRRRRRRTIQLREFHCSTAQWLACSNPTAVTMGQPWSAGAAEQWRRPVVWPAKVEGPGRAPSVAAEAGEGCSASAAMAAAGVARRRPLPWRIRHLREVASAWLWFW